MITTIATGSALTAKYIVQAINKAEAYNVRIRKLQRYYSGDHDILYRVQADPYKPNNRIIINYCHFIAEFMAAYLVGTPIKYEGAPQELLDALNYADADEVTQEAVTSMNITGYGGELHYIDREGNPRITVVDPVECIAVTDDTLEATLQAFIRYYAIEDGDTKYYAVDVYTAADVTHYRLDEALATLTPTGEPEPHYYGDVPFVLYPNNRQLQGSFEQIIPLQDALNKLTSDEINDFEAFVDSYLILTGMSGTNGDDIAAMKQNRVLLMDEGCGAQWLTRDLNTERLQVLKLHLEERIKELAAAPDTSDPRFWAASGTALKMRLISTEVVATKQERAITKAIQRRLELLYNVMKVLGTLPQEAAYTDVTPVFERSTDTITAEPHEDYRGE